MRVIKFTHNILFMEMQHLIRVITVCLQSVLLEFELKMNKTTN